MSQVVSSVKTVSVHPKCGVCHKGRVRELTCGHVYHVKCLKKRCCVTCGEVATISVKVKSDLADATQRLTKGSNGNAFITVNQQDEWGRTTIIREIKKDKINDYMATVKNNKDNKVNGKPNIGLAFMSFMSNLVPRKRNAKNQSRIE
jgi:hypothetical protein